MTLLILGLLLFLGIHSTRVFADGWRNARLAAMGEGAWKGLYSLVSLAGLVMLVWGYGQTRLNPVELYAPPIWTKHLAALLMLASFILLAAAYVPANRLKARLGHPMTLSVKVWALAHLLANGNLGDVLLFGGFLLWSVLVFRAARARDRASRPLVRPGTLLGDLITFGLGAILWAVFALMLHAWLIGVRPFG